MNAYAVRTPNEVCLERGDGIDAWNGPTPDEYGVIAEVVLADTPGQARSIFCDTNDLEFTEKLSIRKLASDIEYEVGINNFDAIIAPLGIQAAVLWGNLSEQEEWQEWEFYLSFDNEVQIMQGDQL